MLRSLDKRDDGYELFEITSDCFAVTLVDMGMVPRGVRFHVAALRQ